MYSNTTFKLCEHEHYRTCPIWCSHCPKYGSLRSFCCQWKIFNFSNRNNHCAFLEQCQSFESYKIKYLAYLGQWKISLRHLGQVLYKAYKHKKNYPDTEMVNSCQKSITKSKSDLKYRLYNLYNNLFTHIFFKALKKGNFPEEKILWTALKIIFH